MIIEKLIDLMNCTNIYVIVDETAHNSIIIDPSNFELVDKFIEANKLCIDYIILTHEHFDHILGVNALMDKYKCTLIASESCSISIMNSKANLSSFSEVLMYFKNKFNGQDIYCDCKKVRPYICRSADITFEESKLLEWNGHQMYMYETPGHSKGSISIVIDNEIVFSGDSLLKNIEVITRFPGGSTKEYNNITLPFYKSLNDNMIVYPGHGQSFILKEKFEVEEN